jgi:hypothetical protein
MVVNKIEEVEELLYTDKITPNQAIEILIKSLGLFDVRFGEVTLTKESVMNEIQILKTCLDYNEVPLFTLAQLEDETIKPYNIKQTFKCKQDSKEK